MEQLAFWYPTQACGPGWIAQTPQACQCAGNSVGRFFRDRWSTLINYDSSLSITGTFFIRLLSSTDNCELLPTPNETYDLNMRHGNSVIFLVWIVSNSILTSPLMSKNSCEASVFLSVSEHFQKKSNIACRVSFSSYWNSKHALFGKSRILFLRFSPFVFQIFEASPRCHLAPKRVQNTPKPHIIHVPCISDNTWLISMMSLFICVTWLSDIISMMLIMTSFIHMPCISDNTWLISMMSRFICATWLQHADHDITYRVAKTHRMPQVADHFSQKSY